MGCFLRRKESWSYFQLGPTLAAMGCWWSIRDVYEKPGYKHTDSHFFHSKLEASLCAMTLSFGSCATLCNPVTAWAVIPYGWSPASSSVLTLMLPLRGAPRGLQEEDQTNCLSARVVMD